VGVDLSANFAISTTTRTSKMPLRFLTGASNSSLSWLAMVSRVISVSKVSNFGGGKSMTKNENWRLCGGTFFTLLLQARKPRMGVRKHYMGESDGLSDPSALIALTKVMIPDYIAPTATMMSTLKGNTSDFKACRISSSVYLPFKDSAALNAFDDRIKTDYRSEMETMAAFISTFINVETSTKKDEYLVKALLELIEKDDSIADGQAFYASEDGSTTTKANLLIASEFCLQSFLLGIWHFVLLNRKDNKVGQETYNEWCPPRGGAERIYTATLGETITRPISVYSKVIEPTIEAEIVDDAPFDEYGEPRHEDKSKEDTSKTTQQTVNNPVVFNQSGNNNIQIGSIETLTINNN